VNAFRNGAKNLKPKSNLWQGGEGNFVREKLKAKKTESIETEQNQTWACQGKTAKSIGTHAQGFRSFCGRSSITHEVGLGVARLQTTGRRGLHRPIRKERARSSLSRGEFKVGDSFNKGGALTLKK